MVDVGERLEAPNAARRARMAQTEPSGWNNGDRIAVTKPQSGHSGTMRPYGSDFLFRIPPAASDWNENSGVASLRPSFARGGLSNGWGASVLPFRDEDLDDWPIRAADLVPHYDAVAGMLSVAARNDSLARLFPAHHLGDDRPLPLSNQAQQLLARLDSRRNPLESMGVHFGQSRQAVAAGCRRCAMCLHGCPYGLIFNAADVVDALSAQTGFSYRPDSYAFRFEEGAGGVRLWTRSNTGEVTELRGDRLFVACGVLPTALLVLNSLDRPDCTVPLRDSQQFFLPMLHRWSADPDPATEPRHTLAQLFLEIVDPKVCERTVHIQVYTHNDTFAIDIGRRFGRFAGFFDSLVGALSRRLIVAQGFLHSDFSPRIELVMRRTGSRTRLEFRRIENAQAGATTARTGRRLAIVARSVGLLPLTPLLRVGALGSSFHCGGSFPMRNHPEGLETDVLGRPAGLRRVHLVDASVFPSIPATTITFSAMANAHRIASQADDSSAA